ARLKELMADPTWRAKYIACLRAACISKNQTHLLPAAEQWRRDHPREGWKISYRASRVARGGKPLPDPRFGPWGRLCIDSARVAAARRGYFTRPKVKQQW